MSGCGRTIEFANRNRLSEILLLNGYGVFVPLIDTGIDMIAHNETTDEIRLIQQKSRWSIAKKYLGRGLWIAFPDDGAWYLAPHDDLVARAFAGVTSSRLWIEKGLYHRAPLGRALTEALLPYRLEAAP